MSYTQNIDGCLADMIGEAGLSSGELMRWRERAEEGEAGLRAAFVDGSLPLLHVPMERDDIAPMRVALDALSDGARTIVFFGTGGSSLGGQTVAQLAGWNIPGDAAPVGKGVPRTRFYDNLDPRTFERALSTLDLARTRFVFVSKSGGTAETLSQAIVVLAALRDAGLQDQAASLVLGLSEPRRDGHRNKLRDLLEPYGVRFLEHHTGVGGRFSVLTNVGMLPAMARGLDVAAIREGAAGVVDDLMQDEGISRPGLGAAVAVGLIKERGVTTNVVMPYSDRLGRMSAWFVQLWSESLGKGGEGSVALGALGPVDQHSQLQLFMDGPQIFMLTFLRTALAGSGPVIDPKLAATCGMEHLGGRTIGDLVDAQQHGVPDALISAKRPVRTMDLEAIDERSLGAVMMHFMIETILAGHLLGLDPFDQPAVEVGKKLADKRLAGMG